MPGQRKSDHNNMKTIWTAVFATVLGIVLTSDVIAFSPSAQDRSRVEGYYHHYDLVCPESLRFCASEELHQRSGTSDVRRADFSSLTVHSNQLAVVSPDWFSGEDSHTILHADDNLRPAVLNMRFPALAQQGRLEPSQATAANDSRTGSQPISDERVERPVPQSLIAAMLALIAIVAVARRKVS